MKFARCVLAGIACAALLPALDHPNGPSTLDLKGRVTGASGRNRMLKVTLFAIGAPFRLTTLTDPSGEFHFHSLPPGTYTISLLRASLGEIRRTVVVTDGLADKKHTVRVSIPYSSSEA